jgi:hypothetical protein
VLLVDNSVSYMCGQLMFIMITKRMLRDNVKKFRFKSTGDSTKLEIVARNLLGYLNVC